jgi:hypothetical protein
MVFDPAAAPRGREAFKGWYRAQTEWSEDHGYDDPQVTTPNLRNWYEAIRRVFPNMNGADAVDDDNVDRAADYSIGKHVIYGAFRWSLAEEAYSAVRTLAVDCEVGFYDVSGDEGDGEIHFPGDSLRPESGGAWRDVAAQFRALMAEN